jgi:Tfp pilus assembly protein PilV
MKSGLNMKREKGFTLIELLISVGFLAVGLLACGLLIAAALASSNRAKLDSGATLVSQRVMDTILAQKVGAAAPQMRDCNPAGAQNWTINYTGAAAPGVGATTDATTGNIDFSAQTNAAVAAGYKMLFVSCGAQGQQATFDVRWNVRWLDATGASRLVTVSARQIGATGTMRWATRPVTLRSIALN